MSDDDLEEARARVTEAQAHVTEALEKGKADEAVQHAYNAAPSLGKLPPDEYGLAKSAFKAALKKSLNLTDLDKVVKKLRRQAQPSRANYSGLPEIVVNNRQLRQITHEGMLALEKANDPPFFFVRGGRLVRTRTDETGQLFIENVSEAHLRSRLTDVADFVTRNDKTVRAVAPPGDLAKNVLALGHWSFPPLDAIVEVPVFRPDGTLVLTAGYDPATRLMYSPSADLAVPSIPEDLPADAVAQALKWIDEAIGEFPFLDDASRANFLGVLLTPVLRKLIHGPVPLALFDAAEMGSGKGLLTEVLTIIITGRPAALMAAPKDDDEWRKRITAKLREGSTIIVIDNIEEPLAAPSLCAAITCIFWNDRILGQSETITLPVNVTWIATGNNIQVRGDMPRRCYWIRLNPEVEKPHLRTGFKHPDLRKWVTEHRGDLLTAVLTIARAWFATGKPKATVPVLGTFESWCCTIGSVLAHAGVAGFLGNLQLMDEGADEERNQWRVFVTECHKHFGARDFMAADICEVVKQNLGDSSLDFGTLPVELEEAYRQHPNGFTRRLGKALVRQLGKRYGGFHIERAGSDSRSGSAQYKVLSD